MADDLVDRLVLLAHGLQAGGIGTSLTEVVDSAQMLRHLDLTEREVLRAGVRSAMVKRTDDGGLFDLLFDRYFPASHRPTTPDAEDRRQSGSAPNTDASPDLLARLLDAVRTGDLDALRELAVGLVDQHSGLEASPSTERYHLYRVMRAADLARLLADAMRTLRTEADHTDQLAARVEQSEHQALLDDFRRMIAEEVRGRLVELVGVQDVVRSTRIDEVEVLRASTTELRALRDAVRPLARVLAARMAARRRLKSRGKLDIRRTARRSMQFGGVPLLPSFRDRRTSKPDVVVLCDVSGSVADFANFTLQLLVALHDELARLRSFVFVDGIAEVSDLLTTSEHSIDPLLDQPPRCRGRRRPQRLRRGVRPVRGRLPVGRAPIDNRDRGR